MQWASDTQLAASTQGCLHSIKNMGESLQEFWFGDMFIYTLYTIKIVRCDKSDNVDFIILQK